MITKTSGYRGWTVATPAVRIISLCLFLALSRNVTAQQQESIPDIRKILQRASNTASLMHGSLDKDLILGKIVLAQTIAEDITGANQTSQLILDGRLKNRSLQDIAVAQVKAGELEKALETVAALEEHRGSSFKEEALSEIAKVQAEEGNVKGALETTRLIVQNHNKAVSFALIAQAQVKGGDQASAKESFQLALQIATSAENVLNKNSTLAVIAKIQADAGEIEAALQTVDIIKDIFNKEFAIRDIAISQATAGKITHSLQLANAITNKSSRNVLLSEIAKVQAKLGDLKGAAATTNTIDNPSSKVHALANIAVFYAKRDDRSTAKKMLQVALDTAQSIPDDSFRVSPLVAIVMAQVRLNDLKSAVQTARLVPVTDNGLALGIIARAQGSSGDVEGAFQTAKSIKRESDRASAIAGIARAQAKKGKWDPALLWSEKRDTLLEKANAFWGVAWGLICASKKAGTLEFECPEE